MVYVNNDRINHSGFNFLNRKQRIADQKMQNDMKKEAKGNKRKTKVEDGQKNANSVQSTLEKMLESSTKQSDAAGSMSKTSEAAGGLEEDDLLSAVKRRRQLVAKAAEEKKMREAQ